jgi:high-affinity nickel-transport protein
MHWEITESTPWHFMIVIAVVLGFRHGLDLDHLATIDAMTRTMRENRVVSKLTGFLFSLGHGAVVTAVCVIIGAGLIKSPVPKWLEGFGISVSIFFLFLFGILNLWSIFQKTPSHISKGLQSFLTQKVLGKKFSPAMVLGVGALFAFSFDTFSQISLFTISATLMSGWLFSGLLGLMFTLGMMIADGCNGLFVSALIQKANKKSQMISRLLGLAVALFSLGIGINSLMKLFK